MLYAGCGDAFLVQVPHVPEAWCGFCSSLLCLQFPFFLQSLESVWLLTMSASFLSLLIWRLLYDCGGDSLLAVFGSFSVLFTQCFGCYLGVSIGGGEFWIFLLYPLLPKSILLLLILICYHRFHCGLSLFIF